MGNTNTNNKKVMKFQQEDNENKDVFFKKYLKKDQVMTILDDNTPSELRFTYSSLISNFRVKKNFSCQKDPFYTIKVVENIRSGRLFNLKIIKKDEIIALGLENFKSIYYNEINSTTTLENPNIEKISGIYINDSDFSDLTVFILCTYTKKKSLLDYLNNHIREKTKFTQKELLTIIKILIEIAYKMKLKNIIYRNFSLQNIYFIVEDNYISLCLRNFYFSSTYKPTQTFKGLTGNLWYLAPEILKENSYDYRSDIWSLGILFYQLLTFENPFENTSNKKQILNILRSNKAFKKFKEVRYLTGYEQIYNLVLNMLDEDPSQRKSLESLEKNPILADFNKYFNPLSEYKHLLKYGKQEIQKINSKVLGIKSLHDFIFYLVYNMRDFLLSSEEQMSINEIYKHFDKNCDGELEIQEIEKALSDEKFCNACILNYINAIKVITECDFIRSIGLSSNCLTYPIFLTTIIIKKLIDKQGLSSINESIKIIFEEIDEDNSGTISIEELQNRFHKQYNKDVKTIFEEIVNNNNYDRNKRINFDCLNLEEFTALLSYDLVK